MAINLSRITGRAQAQPVPPKPANDTATPAAIRRAFKASAIPESIPLTPLTGTGTARQRFDVQMTGLCYLFRVLVHAQVRVTGGAAGDVTWSNTGPYSMFSNSYFADAAGIPRIDCPPFYLYLRRLLYQSFGLNPKASTVDPTNTQLLDDTPIYQAPLATSGGGTVNDIFFWWDMPLTVHGDDLQGLVDLSTPGRRATLGITVNPAGLTPAGGAGVLDDTVPINIKTGSAATVSLSTLKIMCQQYIFGLQGVLNGKVIDLPIPQADMDVIHEIATKTKIGLSTSAAGTFEQLDINRTYISVIQAWYFNSQMTHGQIDGIATRPDGSAIPKGLLSVWMKYSGNKKPLDEPVASYLPYLFDKYGRKMPPGTTWFDWRRKPWNADWVDVLQCGGQLDPGASLAGNTFLDTTYEGLYTGTTSDSIHMAGATT